MTASNLATARKAHAETAAALEAEEAKAAERQAKQQAKQQAERQANARAYIERHSDVLDAIRKAQREANAARDAAVDALDLQAALLEEARYHAAGIAREEAQEYNRRCHIAIGEPAPEWREVRPRPQVIFPGDPSNPYHEGALMAAVRHRAAGLGYDLFDRVRADLGVDGTV